MGHDVGIGTWNDVCFYTPTLHPGTTAMERGHSGIEVRHASSICSMSSPSPSWGSPLLSAPSFAQ